MKNGIESWFPRRLVSSHCVGVRRGQTSSRKLARAVELDSSRKESSPIVLPDFSDDGLKAAGKARDCCEGVNTATLELICLAVALRRSALKELRRDLALRDHLPRRFPPL